MSLGRWRRAQARLRYPAHRPVDKAKAWPTLRQSRPWTYRMTFNVEYTTCDCRATCSMTELRVSAGGGETGHLQRLNALLCRKLSSTQSRNSCELRDSSDKKFTQRLPAYERGFSSIFAECICIRRRMSLSLLSPYRGPVMKHAPGTLDPPARDSTMVSVRTLSM